MKTKTAMIFSGGNIEEDFALSYYSSRKNTCNYIIAADRGLLFLQKNGIVPTHIVGDFDSTPKICLEQFERTGKSEIRKFKPEKDWTDTEIAVEVALELECGKIDILGGIGTRLDHVLGNIQVLALAAAKGAECCLIDSHNRISLHEHPFEIRQETQWGDYISFFAYGGDVEGLTLEGMKYPVEAFHLSTVGTRAVSNEITENCARVSFRSGKLLMVEASD